MPRCRSARPFKRLTRFTCRHCGQWHRVERPSSGRSTAENNYLYVTCNGAQYYAGCLDTPCVHETRQPPIWTLRKDVRMLECSLEGHGEGGWELRLYRNGAQYGARRFVLHEDAVAEADHMRGDCEREGWTCLGVVS
jgi:hypothetical protein